VLEELATSYNVRAAEEHQSMELSMDVEDATNRLLATIAHNVANANMKLGLYLFQVPVSAQL
jgi:hypothetical protein